MGTLVNISSVWNYLLLYCSHLCQVFNHKSLLLWLKIFIAAVDVVKVSPPPVAPQTKASPIKILIEDWQLAAKYKRKPISIEEIGYINVSKLVYFNYTF